MYKTEELPLLVENTTPSVKLVKKAYKAVDYIKSTDYLPYYKIIENLLNSKNIRYSNFDILYYSKRKKIKTRYIYKEEYCIIDFFIEPNVYIMIVPESKYFLKIFRTTCNIIHRLNKKNILITITPEKLINNPEGLLYKLFKNIPFLSSKDKIQNTLNSK